MTRGSASLVGRAAELQRLEAFATGGPGGSRLTVVAGEAGVGKSRLVDELASRVAERARIVRGRADELEPVAFGLWHGPLHQLDLPRPGSEASVPTNEGRWEVVELLADGLRAAAPVLVVLDDLHWADDDALWVLEQLLDRLLDAPVAIVATSRPGSEARAARWHSLYRRAEVIALDGLDVTEVGELVSTLGSADLDAHRLWERTGGNPLFVRELVRAGSDGRLPSTVHDVLVATIEACGPEVAALATVLALAGPDTPLEVVAGAGSLSREALDECLAAARRADLLGDDGLRLRHDLLAAAGAQRVGGTARQVVHLAIADAWARTGGSGAGAAAKRAHHLLLALPSGDATVAVDDALLAAAALRREGHGADAAGLLRLAGSVASSLVEVSSSTKGQLALAEGEARWALDDVEAAEQACEAAIGHARAVGDPVLSAAAEAAAVRHHNPLFPDPVRVARLAEVDAALPEAHDAVDPALRIALRGRRAVLTMGVPDRIEEGWALGDDAVARARAFGDPELLVGALRDRLFVLTTPEDQDLRASAAEEILALARSTGRPGLALQGHEWTYAARLAAGDLTGALAALSDLETLAAIMPSPLWRYAAMMRRAPVLALLGDYEGALAATGAARRLAAGVVPDLEASSIEAAARFGAAALYGRDDHGAEAVHEVGIATAGEAPILFLQARFAQAEVVLGDLTGARRRITPWLGQLGGALRGVEGLPTLGVVAEVAVRLGWVDAAEELRQLLRPFHGFMPAGHSGTMDVSVDHHLADLALLADDLGDATDRAHAAVALARRMRAPAVEARALALLADVVHRAGDPAAATSARDAADAIAEPIGMVLPAVAGAPTGAGRGAPVEAWATATADRRVSMRLDQGRWFVDSPYGGGHLADATGVGQLLRLLAAPGTEIPVADLAGSARASVAMPNDLGPVLDARAKREYRRRIADLQAEIEEAEDHNDPERASLHRIELDALMDQLRAAVGLGGRDRPHGSGNERARINVSRNIRRAIAAIAAAVPDLGAHLSVSIRTGYQCSYAPEPAAALTWEVTRS